MTDLHYRTVAELSRALAGKELSSVELTEAHLERIAALDPRIGAYLAVTPDTARAQAAEADRRIAQGDAGPLTGIPLQLKDNLSTRGIPTTCASLMLDGYTPPYDATVTARLAEAGGALLGKGNMDEFAMGSSNETSAFKTVHNPWDLSRVPGGSSGGPAAAVAAGLAPYALGSDTGGSIRQPAALCGIVGLKPTYGLVSRYGLVAFASSLDQIGPLARSVEDAAVVLNAIAGPDPLDSTSIPAEPPDYTDGLRDGVRGLRVGVVPEYLGDGIDPTVAESVKAALAVLESQGAVVEEVALPTSRAALAVYYVLAPSECSAEPRPVRRREVRLLRPGSGRHVGGAGRDPPQRLRRGGAPPHPDGGVRALSRVLRRLLQEGPAGADAHPPGVPRRLPTRRRPWRSPPLRPRHSRSAASSIPSSCTRTTSAPSPRTSRASPASRSRAASRTASPSGCSCSARTSASPPSSAPPTPTNRRSEWHDRHPAL